MRTKLSPSELLSEAVTIIALALPIIANGLLESSYGFMNTIFVAHLGEKELAAAGLVSMLFATLMVILWGLISGVSIVISHYHGAENKPAIRGVMRDSLFLSLILSVPAMLVLWFAPHIFMWTGQSGFIVQESTNYLHALIWAVPFDLPSLVLMQLFQGISKPRINFIFTLLYIPFLVFMNYAFMFGKFGLPVMGLAGIGWGTTIAYAFFTVTISLFIYYQPDYKTYLNFNVASQDRYFKEILRVGLPLGSMYCLEIGYFLVLAIFFGKIGQVILSAHQVVIQFFWVSMTIVFSFIQAVSIRVGWRLGRKEPHWILPISLVSQLIIFIYGFLIALVYWLFPRYLIHLDFIHAASPSAEFISLAILLFFYTAIFQMADSARLVFFGVLRGMKDTRFTLFSSVITFWGIALPLGYYLAFIRYPYYPQGLWIALIISALIGTGLLWKRLLFKTSSDRIY